MDKKNFSKERRFEDKYLIKLSQIKGMCSIIEQHLKPSYPDKGVKFTFIKSTYLDSDTAIFYRTHLDRKDHRIKLRIRSYGPDGVWDNRYFLEIKEKIDSETHKARMELDPINLKNIYDGKKIKITKVLIDINKGSVSLAEVSDLMNRVNEVLTDYRIRPVLSVTYKRLAYQDKDTRITIDQDITYKNEGYLNMVKLLKVANLIDFDRAQKYGKKYKASTDAVLEVKHQGSKIPEWVEKMLDRRDLEDERMSKYCWAMYRLLVNHLSSKKG